MGIVLLLILFHRGESLEVSILTKVTALIGEELESAKCYFVTLFLTYLAMVRCWLLILLRCSEEKSYTKAVYLEFTLLYSNHYFINQKYFRVQLSL